MSTPVTKELIETRKYGALEVQDFSLEGFQDILAATTPVLGEIMTLAPAEGGTDLQVLSSLVTNPSLTQFALRIVAHAIRHPVTDILNDPPGPGDTLKILAASRRVADWDSLVTDFLDLTGLDLAQMGSLAGDTTSPLTPTSPPQRSLAT